MDVSGKTAPPNPSKRCAITGKEYSISRHLIPEGCRRPGTARSASEWERARRFGRELTVAMVDLDPAGVLASDLSRRLAL